MKLFIQKILLGCLFLFISKLTIAQSIQFAPADKNNGFVASAESSTAFADIDGDKYPDLLISTYNGEDCAIQLYRNNRKGGYTQMSELPFEKLSRSSVAFADIDGDKDQDLLLSGFHSKSFKGITKLYLNDGKGSFTEVKEAGLQGVDFGAIAFADVDNDQDQDIFITGTDAAFKNVALLYLNDGKGRFQETEINVAGVARGAVAFADVDGDQYKDLLVTGVDAQFKPTTILYKNQGNGNFSSVSNTSFVGVQGSSLAFADIDGDNDMDVLVAGLSKKLGATTILYENDGTGSFQLVKDSPFEGIRDGALAFGDFDGDNDLDVLIAGLDKNKKNVATLYQNNGNGNFEILKNAPFTGAGLGAVAFADIDQDNDLDILVTGKDNQAAGTTSLYKNGDDFRKMEKKSLPISTDQLKVYPIPSNGKVYIEAKGFAGSYRLIGLQGQKISEGKISSTGIISIELSKKQKLYMLNVVGENGQSFTYKLIRN